MITISQIIAPNVPDVTEREVFVDFTLALSGSYVVHGDTLNLTQLGDQLKSSQLPVKVEIYEEPAAGTSPTFAQFVFGIGTTQANGVVAIAAAGGTELTAETYASAFPSGLPTLRGRAWFPAY